VKVMSKGQGLSAPAKTCTSFTGTIWTAGCCALAASGKTAATAAATTTTTCRPVLMASTLQRSRLAFKRARARSYERVVLRQVGLDELG
jgi:hypothetical protein